jgi:hypothetical protein
VRDVLEFGFLVGFDIARRVKQGSLYAVADSNDGNSLGSTDDLTRKDQHERDNTEESNNVERDECRRGRLDRFFGGDGMRHEAFLHGGFEHLRSVDGGGVSPARVFSKSNVARW